MTTPGSASSAALIRRPGSPLPGNAPDAGDSIECDIGALNSAIDAVAQHKKLTLEQLEHDAIILPWYC
ncbi:hypothetical protein M728_002164 [Ensifer sp. WSM1721]|uniref:hypothetical protein n=1 Tax=Ensifer sp. WSM1721 TaxID=1041159 RepID=UPI0012EC4961|nr:hypothetical protein [Ensifer sp. WSM1721]